MIISNSYDLKKVTNKALKAEAVGLDTEFMWTNTYYPKLALIQLSLPNDECYIIDPLGDIDLSLLGELLSSNKIVKILHDASQDIPILEKALGNKICNVFDTQLAAGFANLSSTLSLSNLLQKTINRTLAKTETRTNWLLRPLSQKQLHYALDDVRYLIELRNYIIKNTEKKSWLQDELNCNLKKLQYNTNSSDRYRKIRGAGNLSRKRLNILREITLWREKEAQHQNKPRGHIIKDNDLITISKNSAIDAAYLNDPTNFTSRSISKYTSKLLNTITRAQSNNADDFPDKIKTYQLNLKEKDILFKLKQKITSECKHNKIDPQLFCSSLDLKKFIKNQTSTRNKLYSEWRKEIISRIPTSFLPS